MEEKHFKFPRNSGVSKSWPAKIKKVSKSQPAGPHLIITENVLVVRLNNAVFSYIRSSYVSPIIDVARTVFTKAKFA